MGQKHIHSNIHTPRNITIAIYTHHVHYHHLTLAQIQTSKQKLNEELEQVKTMYTVQASVYLCSHHDNY